MTLLYIHVVKECEEEFVIQRISTDKKSWYSLPDDSKNIECHTVLSSKNTIKKTISAIKNIYGYRTVGVKIDDEIRNEYFDEAGNVCFKELPLEEYVDCAQSVKPSHLYLEERIKQLENQLKLNTTNENLHHIEKKFVLEKFDRKLSNPREWLRRFEEECSRFQITIDTIKIQTLRLFVTGSANDWYETNIRKIGMNESWEFWKSSFLNIFIDKGWSIVNKAFKYKYLGGSLIDYALTKEKLCLEVEPDGTELSRINQIVFGLPNEAQEQLDREDITTLDKLYSGLRKLEDAFIRIKKGNFQSPTFNRKTDNLIKKTNKIESRRNGHK